MAEGRRSLRVGDQILREIALLLIHRVMDPRVQGVTMTGIRLSPDLKKARVYFSVIGEQDRIEEARTGLERAKGFIKREIGHRLPLKYVPDLVFVYDPSLERGNHMDRLLEKIRDRKPDDVPG